MRLRDYIDLVESMENRDRTFYHVTPTDNLASIMSEGLVPSVGDRSKKLGENACVFLFPSREDAEDGVDQWMGDDFDDEQPIALLEVTVPLEIEIFKTADIDWEFYTKVTIPPECLTILSRDL